jgi:hypothetical protein
MHCFDGAQPAATTKREKRRRGMKMKILKTLRMWVWIFVASAAICTMPTAFASQGDFYPSYQAKIVGHVALSGNPARQMLLQQTGRKEYLYIKQQSKPGFTVIDVTKPKKAKIVDHIAARNLTIVDPGLAITETPNNSTGQGFSTQAASNQNSWNHVAPESMTVLNVSNPAKPKTVETFHGVTSIVRDDSRKLIYIANGDGIWILSHQTVLRRHLCSSSDAISSAEPNCD